MRLTTIAPNLHELTIGLDLTIFFSYAVPVAAHVKGEGFYVTEQKWSSSTSKHVRAAVGGFASHPRPQEWFDNLPDSLDEAWKPTAGPAASKGT